MKATITKINGWYIVTVSMYSTPRLVCLTEQEVVYYLENNIDGFSL
jgi:hypothetical protein